VTPRGTFYLTLSQRGNECWARLHGLQIKRDSDGHVKGPSAGPAAMGVKAGGSLRTSTRTADGARVTFTVNAPTDSNSSAVGDRPYTILGAHAS
jgi:hypothetical protein